MARRTLARTGPRTPLRGRAIVVAVEGRGIAAITREGFEGDISFKQGDPLGPTGLAARVSFRASVSGSRASVFIEDEQVTDTDTGVAVVEMGAGLEDTYTLRRENGMRAPTEMRTRPLYRVGSMLPPGACTLVGDGHWSVLSDPGREGVLQGRVDNREAGVARWQAYLAPPAPMAVRLGETHGRGGTGDREAGEVEAVVNGHALGWRTFQRAWTGVGWQAPADVWRAGVNEVVLRFRAAAAAGGADGATPPPAPPVTVRRVAVRPGG
jgi:hypothetical protein